MTGFDSKRRIALDRLDDDDIKDPPLWMVFVTGVWTLLAMLGLFSFGMMCIGYWWAKT